jgi:hypothetical protein
MNALMVTIGHSEARDATKSVSWYQAHKAERLIVVAECNDNPGELAAAPNCVNALRANGATSWAAEADAKKQAGYKKKHLVVPTHFTAYN